MSRPLGYIFVFVALFLFGAGIFVFLGLQSPPLPVQEVSRPNSEGESESGSSEEKTEALSELQSTRSITGVVRGIVDPRGLDTRLIEVEASSSEGIDQSRMFYFSLTNESHFTEASSKRNMKDISPGDVIILTFPFEVGNFSEYQNIETVEVVSSIHL